MSWDNEYNFGTACNRLTVILLAILAALSCFPRQIVGMRVDPERIAARLLIEQEIVMDKLAKVGRNRRQLATPKEISISVSLFIFYNVLLHICIYTNKNSQWPSILCPFRSTVYMFVLSDHRIYLTQIWMDSSLGPSVPQLQVYLKFLLPA